MPPDFKQLAEQVMRERVLAKGAPPRDVKVEGTYEFWEPLIGRRIVEVSFEVKELSRLDIEFDAETGEMIEFRNPQAALSGVGKARTADELRALAEALAKPPAAARFDGVAFDRNAGTDEALVSWSHVEDGMEVEYDFIRVRLNPSSGEAISHSRNWTAIAYASPEGAAPIPEERARALAFAGADRHAHVTAFAAYDGARRVWAKIRENIDAEVPYEVVPAWVVRIKDYMDEERIWFQHLLAIHLYTGEIIRYDRRG